NEWNTLSDGVDQKGEPWPVYRETEHGYKPVILEPPREGFLPFSDDWSNMRLGESCSPVFSSLKWYRTAEYEIDVQAKRISCFDSVEDSLIHPPHFLILPSLMPLELTKKLIEAGNRMDDPTADPLLRRIGHGVTMWERAFRCARAEEWEGGWWHE